MVLSDQGRDAEALPLAERAFRAAPRSVRSLVTFGRVLARGKGRLDEAVTHLSRAIAIDPRLQSPRLALGLALLDLGRMSEAARVLSDLLRLAPDSAEAHAAFAEVMLKLGDRLAATRHFKEALRLEPSHPMSRRWMDYLGGGMTGERR